MKILIISQHLFPIQTPRANRTTELVKELGLQGHDVTVYAVLGKYDYSLFQKKYNVKVKNISIRFQIKPYTSDGDNKRTFIDKILGRVFGKIFEFPNIEFKYIIPQIIKNEEKADLLISIADPHHIHWGCAKSKLKYPNKFPKKWIADCGDPFMANIKNKYHYAYYAKYEHEFCQLCDYIAVPVTEAIDAYFPEYRDKIKVIPQGFNFQLPIYESTKPINTIPTFCFAGTFYKDIRNPKYLFNFLENTKLDFKFIVFTRYKELIMEYQNTLKEKLIIREPIPREELIEEMKSMDFLVNIENDNSPNQIPSKLIDYALTGRPILSINNKKFDALTIENFINGDYSKRLLVNNIEQYHIKNVVKLFIELYNK